MRVDDQNVFGDQTIKEKQLSCRACLAPYIINPLNRYKVAWDMALGILYLVCYFLDPVLLVFEFRPLVNRDMNQFQEAVTLILIINMLLTPFTATRKKENILT